MNNLERYERVRKVPKEAMRKIEAGRLKGFTDINPMWRIKILTEEYGEVGIGWRTVTKKKELVTGANGEVAAFLDLELYVNVDGKWSEAIEGSGGSMFVSKEQKGLYTDDECWKKAYTDALSVACKAIGIGADVYYEKDKSKYGGGGQEEPQTPQAPRKAPQKGAGGERKPRRGITLTKLRDFGVTDIRATAKALGEKFKKHIAELNEEETEKAWKILERKKAEKEKADAYRKALQEDDSVPPWEDVQEDEDGGGDE